MTRPQIDYTSLEEWRRDRGITIIQLSEVARDKGVKVAPRTIGEAFRFGLPLHGRVMLAWRDAFGWTNEEMLWLCMNGPQVKLN